MTTTQVIQRRRPGGVKGVRNRLQLAQSQQTAAQRLEARTTRAPHPKGCWLWAGSHNQHGYGKFAWARNGKKQWQYAHRVSYETHNGPIPAGMHVLHKCDNTGCVNPAHLELGTHLKNMLDKNLRGRDPRCLSPERVRAIRAELDADKSFGAVKRIAAKHGIGAGVACQIKLRRKYAYVE